MSVSKRHALAMRIMASSRFGADTGVLAVLVQKSDCSWMIPKSNFPVGLMGEGRVFLDDEVITRLASIGVVMKGEGGLQVMPDATVTILNEPVALGTNTTINCRSSKNSSTTNFLFEKCDRHGRSFAFVQEIGARVRAGIVSQVAPMDFDAAQMVVHEVGARVLNGSIKGDAVTYARGIVAKALRGQFVPAAGLALADEFDAQFCDDVVSERKGLLRIVK